MLICFKPNGPIFLRTLININKAVSNVDIDVANASPPIPNNRRKKHI